MGHKLFMTWLLLLAYLLPVKGQFVRDTNITVRVLNFNWTPDGKTILFTGMKWDKRVKGASVSAIFSYDPDNNEIRKIFDDGNNPALSPDGKKIAYTRYVDNSSDIYVYDLSQHKSYPLATDTTREFMPSWSPDGKWITYAAERNREINVCITEVSTGHTKQITDSKGHRSYSPVWSPDGKHIVYYFETGDNRDQVFLTDPAGSFHKNLTNDTATHNFYPSWVNEHEIIYTRNSTGIATIRTDGNGLQPLEGIRSYLARKNPRYNQVAYIGISPEQNLMLFDPETKSKKVLLDEQRVYGLF